MNSPQSDKSTDAFFGGAREKHFLDYVTVFLKWRRFIIITLFVVLGVAIAVSLLLPKSYKATVSILSPLQQDIFSSLGASSSPLRSLAGAARLGGFGQRSGAYNYMAILNSRSAMEAVSKKFDLPAVYEISDSSMEKTIKQLEDNSEFEEQKDDYITITVHDRDPIRAAAMANYFVEVLNGISVDLGTREARDHREFIGSRLADAREELRHNEDSLKQYQVKSGMMITPEASSSINAIAALYGLKTRKEVELAVAERTATGDNPAFQQLRIELAELDKKLATIPQKGLESFRLYREVAIQQRVVEFLVPLYEQARIDEQKDIPVVLVLDRAVPPERKDKPKRMFIVAGAGLASILFSCLLVLIRERIRTLAHEDPQRAAQLQEIRRVFGRLVRRRGI